MAPELAEQVRRAALHGQQQQAEEVEQRQRRVDAQVGAGAADLLHAKAGVGLLQPSGEEKQALVGGAHVADQQVGEDAARGVERCRVRGVFGVPVVFEACERFGGVARAEEEVPFGVVGFVVCLKSAGY